MQAATHTLCGRAEGREPWFHVSGGDAAAGVCAVRLCLGGGVEVPPSPGPLPVPTQIKFRSSKSKFSRKLRGGKKNFIRLYTTQGLQTPNLHPGLTGI